MENLAHIALWRYEDGRVGSVTLTPRLDVFEDEARLIALRQHYKPYGTYHFFSPGQMTHAQGLIASRFSVNVCPICQNMNTPCWYWMRRHGDVSILAQDPHAGFVHPVMQQPANLQEEMRILLQANPNALNQILAASPNLRNALAYPEPLQTRQSRQRVRSGRMQIIGGTPGQGGAPAGSGGPVAIRSGPMDDDDSDMLDLDAQPRAVIQPPTPAGTIRCTACGQVIPPGFEKEKDTKKTEDEIYAECKHDFDENKICRKCRLHQRANSRFSWLEVD